jgi:hypothetical protein
MRAFDEQVEIPDTVARLYDRWHEEHQRTANIPERPVYGYDGDGNKLWCSLPDAGPELLVKVAEYHHQEGLRKLEQYRQGPSEQLPQEIASHMVGVDIADQLCGWWKDGVESEGE